ncbi:hypothetical protein K440DRAFT_682601 [Wilcoxina mikolae CBS 423.85]|nr:hypothetical protein K440DRAFT_682601 [Wilcoxina mikolae CBS 423.85]
MSSYSSPSEYSYSYHHTSPRQIVSITEINQMRQTLRHRRVNTLTELCRIERVLTSLPGPEYIDELTDAWGYYVSTNFLQELRGLTRQYPFSTELVEDAKARVYNDPKSCKSWNLAWLLLAKMKTDQMIPQYAVRTANQPSMWGGVVPNPIHAAELANILNREWSRAVDQLLKHYPTPPTVNGDW